MKSISTRIDSVSDESTNQPIYHRAVQLQVLKQSTGRRSYLAMVLSLWSKVFVKFTAPHSQLCTCLCFSGEDTKPPPSTNHKALRATLSPYNLLSNALFAGLSRKPVSHSNVPPDLALFHNAATNSSAPEHSHPQVGQGNPCHTNPFHPQQAGRGSHSPNPKHGWHKSQS